MDCRAIGCLGSVRNDRDSPRHCALLLPHVCLRISASRASADGPRIVRCYFFTTPLGVTDFCGNITAPSSPRGRSFLTSQGEKRTPQAVTTKEKGTDFSYQVNL